jgi:hypothetical protein
MTKWPGNARVLSRMTEDMTLPIRRPYNWPRFPPYLPQKHVVSSRLNVRLRDSRQVTRGRSRYLLGNAPYVVVIIGRDVLSHRCLIRLSLTEHASREQRPPRYHTWLTARAIYKLENS